MAGPWASVTTSPSTRRAGPWQPTRSPAAGPPVRLGEPPGASRGWASRAVARHLGPVPAAEPGLRPEGGADGQAARRRRRHRVRRTHTALQGTSPSPASSGEADAGPRGRPDDWGRHRRRGRGQAPTSSSVMMPELYSPTPSAVGKPLLRVHTAGSVGGSTRHRGRQPHCRRASTSRCSPVAFEKQSEQAMWAFCRCRCRSRRRWWRAPAASSPPHRAYMPVGAPPTSTAWWPGRTARTPSEPARPPPEQT